MNVDADTDATSGVDVKGCDDVFLRIHDLDADYDSLQILTDVGIDVSDGECATIVSPSGAGKSMTMKLVFDLTAHIGGTVRFKGGDIAGCRPEGIIHVGIGYVPQNGNIFPTLTVEEGLEMGVYILDEMPQDAMETVYGRFPTLREWRDQKVGTISGGQQQMLAVGHVPMFDPDLLLLDEPSVGSAFDLVEEMFGKVGEINEAGMAVLMAEQNAKKAFRRYDHGYALANGQNRYMDTGTALLEDEQVQ